MSYKLSSVSSITSPEIVLKCSDNHHQPTIIKRYYKKLYDDHQSYRSCTLVHSPSEKVS